MLRVGEFLSRVEHFALIEAREYVPEIRVAVSVVTVALETYVVYRCKREVSETRDQKVLIKEQNELKGQLLYLNWTGMTGVYIVPNEYHLAATSATVLSWLLALGYDSYAGVIARLTSMVVIGRYVGHQWGPRAGMGAGLVVGMVSCWNALMYKAVMERQVRESS